MHQRLLQCALLAGLTVSVGATLLAQSPAASSSATFGRQVSGQGIRHSFLVTGNATAIIGEDDQIIWKVDRKSRDGFVLPNGNVLISHGDEAIEYGPGKSIVFRYRLHPDNRELGTVVRLDNGNTMLVERGVKPRILEVAGDGSVVKEVPLQPETDNVHMQTRQARKRSGGTYLVPHLLAFAVKEYDENGKVLRRIETDLEQLGGRAAENWPFTAIELPNQRLLVTLTHGNKVAEFDEAGKVAWLVDNSDVAQRLSDPCGAQRLLSGHTVICSYGQRQADKPKVLEITPQKEVVWEYFHEKLTGIHEIHVLTTNGQPERWPALK